MGYLMQKLNSFLNVWSVDWLFVFYGISNLLEYLMPNPVYSSMICKLIVYRKQFLNKPEVIYLDS